MKKYVTKELKTRISLSLNEIRLLTDLTFDLHNILHYRQKGALDDCVYDLFLKLKSKRDILEEEYYKDCPF